MTGVMFKGDVQCKCFFVQSDLCLQPAADSGDSGRCYSDFNRFAYRHTEMQGMEKYGLYQADKNWSWHHFEHRYYRPRVNF